MCAVAVATCMSGCTTTIIPPSDPADPVSVYVIDYGRHASLLLPQPDGEVLIEYAYGDWGWFSLDESQWYDVFPTLFWPTQGSLGRWQHRLEGDRASVRRSIACEEVLEVVVGSDDVARLLARLESRYRRQIDTRHYQSLYRLNFVHDEEDYHVFHNCNHVLAEWLRELGCDVRGLAMSADFVVRAAK